MNQKKQLADLRPIETQYAGHYFRSRLEARWAILFDSIGVKWQYEPSMISIGDVLYVPDFFLPDYDAFAEIKPEIDGDRIEKPIALATQKKTIVFVGEPYASLHVWLGFPGSASKVIRAKLGLCERCNKFLACVIGNVGTISLLETADCRRHQFVYNPDITMWNHAFHLAKYASADPPKESFKPFPVIWPKTPFTSRTAYSLKEIW